ncbi:hypothetical protein [Athalassotoga saccharophila]|uniref:hypothetical protein n=1 Tax=Athalassotoga saccharophila TaxID=1441386 RepID=UPI00137B4A6A|nr:hypothetical protein [Athalassotoga saccharophila]BBJ28861.1 hypothetical protein ATHSA_1783 [Athalassotoga saccharophila]
MKKFIVILIVGLTGVTIFASNAFKIFPFFGTQWTTSYSQEIGNLVFLESVGTTGVFGAVGFSKTFIDRQRVGFIDLMVGKTKYVAALGFDLNPIEPVGYFQYETMRTMAPIFYDLNLELGNYALGNFGVDMTGTTQFVFSNLSLYAQTHFYLVFQSDFQGMANLDLSYNPWKASFLTTNEVGNLYFLTGGFEIKKLGISLDAGTAYNEKGFAPAIGLSSSSATMGNNWFLRASFSQYGPAIYTIFMDGENQLTFGYNQGAVYLSVEN